MRTAGIFATALTAAAFFAKTVVADVDPIIIKGSKFFYKTNGTQFYIKGVAYQQEYSANDTQANVETTNTNYKDPLSNGDQCRRDIPYLVQLGTNTIRSYAIDPNANHDDCMKQLADAGIYVIADLSAPGASIIRDNPKWNVELFARYAAVIDSLQKYNNVMGFFAGNEVSNQPGNTNSSAFVKAAVRDMKKYIKDSGYRTIGVGYATNDDPAIREPLANYMDCGDNRDEAIDFWGYNIYSWCGNSNFEDSQYKAHTEEFASYNVPVFFAEYGCNKVQPRTFSEVATLFGPEMNDVWSGGIVYMYFQEGNNYGLVSIVNNAVQTRTDFAYLSSAIAKVTATGVQASAYNPTNTAAAQCPSVDATWQADSILPPVANQKLCSCMYSALTCVPNIAAEDYGKLFGVVCGYGNGVCDGISTNVTSGDYGAYSMCNSTEQLGWVLNTYLRQQQKAGNGASACDFGGSATTKAATSPSGECSTLVAAAGPSGTGSVTAAPNGNNPSKGRAAGGFNPQMVHVGYLQVAFYLGAAVLSGMAMILL